MTIVIHLALDFVESVLIVWCYQAARRGDWLYAIAGAGVFMALLGRLTSDIGPAAETIGLQVGGLLLAGLVLAFYLLTEEVESSSPAE